MTNKSEKLYCVIRRTPGHGPTPCLLPFHPGASPAPRKHPFNLPSPRQPPQPQGHPLCEILKSKGAPRSFAALHLAPEPPEVTVFLFKFIKGTTLPARCPCAHFAGCVAWTLSSHRTYGFVIVAERLAAPIKVGDTPRYPTIPNDTLRYT